MASPPSACGQAGVLCAAAPTWTLRRRHGPCGGEHGRRGGASGLGATRKRARCPGGSTMGRLAARVASLLPRQPDPGLPDALSRAPGRAANRGSRRGAATKRESTRAARVFQTRAFLQKESRIFPLMSRKRPRLEARHVANYPDASAVIKSSNDVFDIDTKRLAPRR